MLLIPINFVSSCPDSFHVYPRHGISILKLVSSVEVADEPASLGSLRARNHLPIIDLCVCVGAHAAGVPTQGSSTCLTPLTIPLGGMGFVLQQGRLTTSEQNHLLANAGHCGTAYCIAHLSVVCGRQTLHQAQQPECLRLRRISVPSIPGCSGSSIFGLRTLRFYEGLRRRFHGSTLWR